MTYEQAKLHLSNGLDRFTEKISHYLEFAKENANVEGYRFHDNTIIEDDDISEIATLYFGTTGNGFPITDLSDMQRCIIEDFEEIYGEEDCLCCQLWVGPEGVDLEFLVLDSECDAE